MNKLKNVLIVASFIAAILCIVILSKNFNTYKNLYNSKCQTVQAYMYDNSKLSNTILQYELSLKELKNSKDSMDIKMKDMAKNLKISNNKIKSMQHTESVIYKSDTIIFRDTVLEHVNIDTTIWDQWYKLGLKLEYPSTVVVSPTFISDEYVYIHEYKECVKEPSKYAFIRFFQRKHKVIKVTTKELNPYIEIKNQKFIKVVK